MPNQDPTPVVLAELENSMEADLLSALLEEAGIAHRIRIYNDTASAGVFSMSRPWGAVEAQVGRRDSVLRMLQAVRHGGTGSLPDSVPDPVNGPG